MTATRIVASLDESVTNDLEHPLIESLTERELDVLALLAQDKTNQEIAVDLSLSINTVKWYARQIYGKLGVGDRHEAVRRALALGLLPEKEADDLPPHNLPAQLTPFVGRREELATLEELLEDPATRLLTIVGPGGMGKTQLALQVALQQLQHHPQAVVDGVTFVPLSEVGEVRDIPERLAHTLGLAPLQAEDGVMARLQRYLRQRQILLLLDEAEHLVGQELSALLDDLLSGAPDLTVLATSRARLNVRGEQLFWVEGLTLGTAGATSTERDPQRLLGTSSAVALFLHTARRSHPQFALTQENASQVMEVCRLVEGMPLGIELAAAWVGLLTLDELLEELSRSLDILATEAGNVPPGQRSLRAVFDTSWALLEESDRHALRCLSVFRGGFTREAAQDVCDLSLPDLLTLVNKCWLKRDETGRFSMHSVLQQYAAEALEAHPEQFAETRARHSATYCRWLAAQQEVIVGPQQQETLTAVERELGNIRTACLAAIETDQMEPLAESVHALGRFYRWQGSYWAGERFFETLLQALGDNLNRPQTMQMTRLRLLVWRMTLRSLLGHIDGIESLALEAETQVECLGREGREVSLERLHIAHQRGYIRLLSMRQPQEALRYFVEAYELARRIKSPAEEAQALLGLARARRDLHQWQEAERAVVEATKLFQDGGHELALAEATALRGNILWRLGHSREAAALLEEGSYPAISHAELEAVRLFNLGAARNLLGQFDDAERAVAEGIEIHRENYEGGTLWAGLLGLIHLHQGRYEAAVQTAEMAARAVSASSRTDGQAVKDCILGIRALVHGRWDEAGEHLRRSLATRKPSPDWHAPVSYGCLALASRKLGNGDHARQFLKAELQVALASRRYEPLIVSLLVAALLLADRGELERATELYTRIWQEPFARNSVWLREVAGRELQEISAGLPDEARAAAQERGQGLDLWQMAEELVQAWV